MLGDREYALRLQQVRPVDHAAVQIHDPSRRRQLECRDHPLRMLALGRRRCKRGVDRGNLVRVNCQLAAETVATSRVELALQPCRIAKIGTHAIDGLRDQRRRGEQALGARVLEGESQRARDGT